MTLPIGIDVMNVCNVWQKKLNEHVYSANKHQNEAI